MDKNIVLGDFFIIFFAESAFFDIFWLYLGQFLWHDNSRRKNFHILKFCMKVPDSIIKKLTEIKF